MIWVMVVAVKQTNKCSVFYLQTRAPKIIIKKSRKTIVSFKGIYSLLGCGMPQMNCLCKQCIYYYTGTIPHSENNTTTVLSM